MPANNRLQYELMRETRVMRRARRYTLQIAKEIMRKLHKGIVQTNLEKQANDMSSDRIPNLS
jgi:glucose-6-phosphate-specific signal transduction histidine kinase